MLLLNDWCRIPITCALVVYVFLHRRFIRRQRIEDANDPHRSLDFGVDLAPSKSKGGKVPEMTVTDRSDTLRKHHHLSMDDDIHNPYLLPAALQGSRESIHSMSRSVTDEHDPYRPVTMMRTSTDTNRPRADNASVYSASTDRANLLVNAQRSPLSDPNTMSPQSSGSTDELSSRQLNSTRSVPPSQKSSLASTPIEPTLPQLPPPRKQSLVQAQNAPLPPPPAEPPVEQPVVRPPRKSSASAGSAARSASLPRASSGESAPPPPPVPTINHSDYDVDPSMISTGRFSIDTPNPSTQFPAQPQANRMSVMGLRPLPPDMPAEDNPEVRANRIRSFYKEYFDDSRPNPAHAQYEEDYDASYLAYDGAIFDPETGGYAVPGARPFAAPPGRRAMTPPPRGAPRFAGAHARHTSTMSAQRAGPRGRPPQQPRIRAPPPKPLQGLPTPHKLKDYDSVINSPIDFAPPSTFRTMQNGSAPDSPVGVSRPFSPMVRPFTPLATAYDELSVMPSPHMLRKSGTFTALDFAPPSRLGVHNDNASDAGSIRSARSGISAMQLDAVRAGAYRVSRIPKEMVTSREDLSNQLRPKMNLITPA